MKQIIFTSLLTITISVGVKAQSKVTLLKNNPLPALKLYVDPVAFDLWSTNIANTSAGVRAEYFLNDLFSFYGIYRKAIWLDGLDMDATKYIPKDGFKTHHYTELNGYFHFKDRTVDGDVNIELSRSNKKMGRNKTQTTIEYLPVQSTIRKYTSVRLGIHNFNTSLNLKGFDIEGNGTKKHVTSLASAFDTSTIQESATMQYSTFLATGITSSKLINVLAESSRYGKLKQRLNSELYFDLFWGLSQHVDDVIEKGIVYTPILDLKGSGWRAGWRKAWGGVSMYMELGTRPGPKGKNDEYTIPARFYTMMGFGFQLGSTFGKSGL